MEAERILRGIFRDALGEVVESIREDTIREGHKRKWIFKAPCEWPEKMRQKLYDRFLKLYKLQGLVICDMEQLEFYYDMFENELPEKL